MKKLLVILALVGIVACKKQVTINAKVAKEAAMCKCDTVITVPYTVSSQGNSNECYEIHCEGNCEFNWMHVCESGNY